MVIEDIKYQLNQFSNFENVRLIFDVAGKRGFIYSSEGKIVNASFGEKNDLDAFRELKEIDGKISIEVSIGKYPPKVTLNKKTLDEIIALLEDGANIYFNENKQSNEGPYYNAPENYAETNFIVDIAAAIKKGEKLSKVPGIENVVVIKSNDELIYSNDMDNADSESAYALFLLNHVKELGNDFNFGDIKSAIYEAEPNESKRIVINYNDIIYGLKVSSAGQSLKIYKEAAKLLKRKLP